MDISLFDFDLPEELIAQIPVDERDRSRLMVVDRKKRSWSHHSFSEIADFLPKNGLLIRNNARVLPARLHGFRSGGGAAECLLLHPAANPNEWWCLIRPGKKLGPGKEFGLTGEWTAQILAIKEDGQRLVRFIPEKNETFLDLVNRLGEIPLPPYIHRKKNDARRETDRDRYQTVYAKRDKQVAAAAPTAGLHFTERLQDELLAKNFSFADLTLHIGLGTFQPIQSEQIEDHTIHREVYEIPATLQQILRAKDSSPRIAVGTTVTRAVEDFLRKNPQKTGGTETFVGEAGLFIYPPYDFRGINALITNFHLPRSTLLCMVSAFLSPGKTDGIDWIREIYTEAIREKYRFFSYGDAMLII
ncbi:MAG TPA: tRNA preQ1(34) S-adenosylmethionine ribosyltransferase-isomerase QueA [Opitutales bacterium]|nr:tRNA preQ1(34) S-adenosylmethionine ribosyltransferase-isomerase QueA [Opitutales bacterium]